MRKYNFKFKLMITEFYKTDGLDIDYSREYDI